MSRKTKAGEAASAQDTVQEPVQETMQEPAAQEALTEPTRVYVGPSVQRLGLSQYAIFQGGIPGHLKQEQERHPALASLFVPVSRLARAREELKDPTSALSVLRDQFISQLSGKKSMEL